jgi:hypothetical protein
MEIESSKKAANHSRAAVRRLSLIWRGVEKEGGRLCFLSKLKGEAIAPAIAAPVFNYCCVGFSGVSPPPHSPALLACF